MIATKQQELEALKKIQKIVDELGTDSYLAITFNGCFDLAKENIENDWANNYKDMYDLAIKDLNVKCIELSKTIENSNTLGQEVARLKNDIECLESALNGQQKLTAQISDAKRIACDELRESKDEIATLNSTITELKAKLYDLIAK